MNEENLSSTNGIDNNGVNNPDLSVPNNSVSDALNKDTNTVVNQNPIASNEVEEFLTAPAEENTFSNPETQPNPQAIYPPTNELVPPEPKKKKIGLVVGLIVGLIVILGIGGFLAYYFFFATNPTDVLKNAINDVYTDFSANLNKLENNNIAFSLNDSFKLSGDMEVSGSLLEGIQNDKINFAVGLDYKNKKAEITAGLTENNQNLLDGSVYFTNNHYYLKSDSLLNNIYDLGEYDFAENFDLSELEEILNGDNLPNYTDIDYIVRELKDALIKSLNEDDMEQTKAKLKINATEIDTTKITYNLNSQSVKNLMKALTKEIAANDQLLTKLSDLSQTDKEDIKESLEEFQSDEFYEDTEGTGTFVVYTTGITNKFAGFELNIDDDGKLAYYTSKNDAYFIFQDADNELEITSVKKNNISDIRVNLTFDGQKEEIAKLTVRAFDSENIDFDISINYEDMNISGSVKSHSQKVSDKEVNGDIEVSVNYDEDSLTLKMTYNLKIGDAIANITTSNALTADDMTEEDTTKLMNKLEELQETELYKFIEDYIPIGNVTDTDIYDDDNCFDDYLQQDEIDSYQEYYDQYCTSF